MSVRFAAHFPRTTSFGSAWHGNCKYMTLPGKPARRESEGSCRHKITCLHLLLTKENAMRTTRCLTRGILSFALLSATFGLATMGATSEASAAGRGHDRGAHGSRAHGHASMRSFGHSHSRVDRYDYGRSYHRPSVHYDTRYHADSYHWTPFNGVHAHGHYDSVPHYTRGHHHD